METLSGEGLTQLAYVLPSIVWATEQAVQNFQWLFSQWAAELVEEGDAAEVGVGDIAAFSSCMKMHWRSNIGEALKWLFCTNGLLDIGTLKILSPQYLNLAWVFVHALQIFWSFSIIARCSALVTLQLFAPNPVANRALSLLTLGYIFEVQMLTRVQAILQSSFLQTNPQAWNLFSKSWSPASVSANTCEGQLSKHHHASLQQTPAKLLVQAECWCFILKHYQLILNCRRYKSI